MEPGQQENFTIPYSLGILIRGRFTVEFPGAFAKNRLWWDWNNGEQHPSLEKIPKFGVVADMLKGILIPYYKSWNIAG